MGMGFQCALYPLLTPLACANQDTIFQRGESSEDHYFLRKGTVDVLAGGARHEVLYRVNQGQYFGEEVLTGQRRYTTVVSNGFTELWSLAKEDLLGCAAWARPRGLVPSHAKWLRVVPPPTLSRALSRRLSRCTCHARPWTHPPRRDRCRCAAWCASFPARAEAGGVRCAGARPRTMGPRPIPRRSPAPAEPPLSPKPPPPPSLCRQGTLPPLPSPSSNLVQTPATITSSSPARAQMMMPLPPSASRPRQRDGRCAQFRPKCSTFHPPPHAVAAAHEYAPRGERACPVAAAFPSSQHPRRYGARPLAGQAPDWPMVPTTTSSSILTSLSS